MPDQTATQEHHEDQRGGIGSGLKRAVGQFLGDSAMTWAAATAFYAGISLAPLLTVAAWLLSRTLGEGSVERLKGALISLFGQQPGEQLASMLARQSETGQPTVSGAAGLASLGLLVLAATGVFAQLQASFNHLWHVEPRSSSEVWKWLRKRIMGFFMLLGILALLIASTVLSTALTGLTGGDGGPSWIWEAINSLVSLAVFTAVFGLMFRYMPDAQVPWKDVWIGAAITAVLFLVGQFLLAWYLGRGRFESSYGAAIGSFVALLIWVYYSSVILFFGAEVTRVEAARRGRPVVADDHAHTSDTDRAAPRPA